MKAIVLKRDDFNNLSQNDRIEYLLRKDAIIKNIRSSFPMFELFAIIFVIAYSRLYNLVFRTFTFIVSQDTNEVMQLLSYANTLATFANAVVVILVISFITRILRYFLKTRQLSELNLLFLDRLNPILVERKGKK